MADNNNKIDNKEKDKKEVKEPSLNEEEESDIIYEKLKKSKFKQQAVPTWRPKPTVTSTTVTFICFGLIFIAIGLIILHFSDKVYEKKIDYSDNICKLGTKCELVFKIEQEVSGPVILFYELDNFYQNHRLYAKSRNDEQLHGKTFTNPKDLEDCKPAVYNVNMSATVSVDGTPLVPDAVAVPCGFIAKTVFTDTFELYDINAQATIPINEKGIAWPSDVELFKNTVDGNKTQWLDMTDEHFIVWMRPAGFPIFRKIWGKIEQNLKPGDYKFIIDSKYNNTEFLGKKYVVLSTVEYFDGKNKFLGISYLSVGGLCIVVAIVWVIGFGVLRRATD